MERSVRRCALLVGSWQPTDVFSSPSTRKGAKRGTPRSTKPRSSTAVASPSTSSSGILTFRAGIGFVYQGHDWKTIDMTPRYYGGFVARGYAADIRATEVPADYKAKARKADRDFNGVGYVRNGPPGPVLALLRSMPPTIDLAVGARGELSRSVKQFVPDCAEKG